jgi:hypothetical protein
LRVNHEKGEETKETPPAGTLSLAIFAALDGRVDQLEALLEGLQDTVHRESVRAGGRIDALEKRSEPAEISRALSRDARERGL